MSTYPDDLCLSDAEANGLDPEALREQVLELLGTGVELDPARLRAGVRLDLDAERSAFVRASGNHRALPAPRSSHWSTVRRHVFSRSAAIGMRPDIATVADAVERALEQNRPGESSRIRRLGQHLSATASGAIAPLAQAAAAYSTGGASLAVAGAAGMAGVAAVGGLTSSIATHEHHTQAQDMSRRLQRVALEQDRRLHGEAQGLAAELSREALEQEARLHRQGLWRERRQHDDALAQERALHDASLRVDHRLHFEGILADLREQDREADRDLWEQRTERFQLLLTVSSLLTAGGFALAVEGTLPPESDAVAPLHYFLLALGFGLQLCVILGCLSLTARFAEFMDLRVHKQQLLNKDLRRVAVRMLDAEGPRSRAEDDLIVNKFERVLRQQYVIETCDAGHPGRHIWNFKDWYEQRCVALAIFVESSFRFGMLGLLGSVLTYIYAVLEMSDADDSVRSHTAWLVFGITLGTLIAVAVVVPQLIGSSWMWRLMRDSFRRGEPHFFGLLAPHKPVRFDMHHVSDQAEDLFHAIDTDGSGTLSVRELEAAAITARRRAEAAREQALASPVVSATNGGEGTPAPAPLPPSVRTARIEPTRARGSILDGDSRENSRHGADGGGLNGGLGIIPPATRPATELPEIQVEDHVGEEDSYPVLDPARRRDHRRASPTFSPRGNEDAERRRVREEKAAATAVLETIIRQMADRGRKTNRDRRRAQLVSPRAGAPAAATRSFAPQRRRGASRAEWDLTKEAWDDAIAEALF